MSEWMRNSWYAVYTQPRHEKTVAQQFSIRSIHSYLPLYEATRRWKDRRVTLSLPLFPGYIFVRTPVEQRIRVLEVPSVVCIVGNGKPLALADDEIERLRESLKHRKAQPCSYLERGKKVRIQAGPLAGLEGTVLRKKGKLRLVVSIAAIQRSIAMEVEACDLQVA